MIIQNLDPIDINFLFWNILSIPKFKLIITCLVVGFLIGVLCTVSFFQKKNKVEMP